MYLFLNFYYTVVYGVFKGNKSLFADIGCFLVTIYSILVLC